MLRSGSSAAAIELPLQIDTAAHRERPRRPSPLDGRVVRADPVFVGASMRHAIEAFGSVPDLRYLAVVDASGAPVGALPEPLVRDFLFSPFGHALLANPGYSHGLRHLVRDCPTAEADAPIEGLVAAYGTIDEAEGLILTRGGRYWGLLPSQALLRMAADMATARNQRLEAAFKLFRQDAIAFGHTLTEAAGEIGSGAAGAADRAQMDGRQAIAVAAASKQSADGIAEISDSSAMVADQVKAVESQLVRAKAIVGETVTRVEDSAMKTQGLGLAANEIGSVVGVISDIARTVDLLAMNASIEAVRAGEAGRGFAVVAVEVKSLAAQVARAADQVGARIGSVRDAIIDTAASHRLINEIVGALDGIAASILGSAMEQSTATMQIAASAEDAAVASAQITSHVADISERAAAAEQVARRMAGVAEALTGTAGQLQARVDAFLTEVLAA